MHAGRQHNKTTGGPWLERREELDQRRGKIFAKSIRWAEWDENTETESRSLSRKKCEKQKWMDGWVEGWMDG